jgi:GT2 family glycosyltransferase
MTDPSFSIVIPTYNRPAPLWQCLAALRRQEYPADRVEVIVVDDGSTCAVDAVVDAFPQVRLIRQANAGPAAARNTGARAATHAFLAFTDDDCAPRPHWLSEMAASLRADPTVLVGGCVHNALPSNACATASQLILDVVNDHFNRDHQRASFFPSDNMAMSRQQFLELGGFDESFRCSEDRDLCDRWTMRGWRLVFNPAAGVDHAHEMGLLGFWRQHFGYGRGAWQFHRARARRGSGPFTVEGGFYSRCFREPFRRLPLRRALPVASLMFLWQFANTAGLCRQALHSQFRKPPSAHEPRATAPAAADGVHARQLTP